MKQPCSFYMLKTTRGKGDAGKKALSRPFSVITRPDHNNMAGRIIGIWDYVDICSLYSKSFPITKYLCFSRFFGRASAGNLPGPENSQTKLSFLPATWLDFLCQYLWGYDFGGPLYPWEILDSFLFFRQWHSFLAKYTIHFSRKIGFVALLALISTKKNESN